tara:strand:+ start:113 stop:370 length:258 start_codon:yes stop_codon:yes gene_type:complete
MSIEISNLNGTNDGDGDATIVGIISNKGKRPLNNITVEITLFDDGALCGVEEDYIDSIPPGGKRAFEVNKWDCWFTNFEVQVYGG